MLQSKHYKLLPAILLVVLQLAAASLAAASTAPLLPILNWQQRSDWINVKADVTPAAVGDGVHDDTAAIQAALNRIDDNWIAKTKTVYFPPGTYRITRTLVLSKSQGAMLVGHGRATRIVWGGSFNQTMFLSNGATMCRYVGLIWDGAGKAAVGQDHCSKTNYETRIRNQDEEFINFRRAGIRVGYNQTVPTAEMMFRNCLFQNCDSGVAFLQWNDYNNDFEGCDFRDCGTAINCQLGNVYVRDTHFERSTITDIYLSAHSHSVRRCTSVGSRQFINVPPAVVSCEVAVQDCHVDGWTGSSGAVALGMRGPTTIFDCSFTRPPDSKPPIRLTNNPTALQAMILSNNTAPSSTTLVDPGAASQIAQIPAGARGPNLNDPTQSLFISTGTVTVPSSVLDVKTQFGATGDCSKDDTQAILSAIRQASAQGGNTLVYLPPGLYNVSATLPVTGRNYTIGGSGYKTQINWTGQPGGAVFSVQDPQNVTLEQMLIRTPNSAAGIQQTSAGAASSYMTYDGIVVNGFQSVATQDTFRGLECIGLPASATVHLLHIDGSTHFTDCSRATILCDFGGDGVLQVDGSHYEKSGFLGILMKTNAGNPCDIVIHDNQDLVGTNMYTEQTTSFLSVSGDGAYPGQPGHVTVQGTECNIYNPQVLTVNDYEGRMTLTGMQFNNMHQMGHSIAQTGTRPVDIVLLGNMFWASQPEFSMDSGGKSSVVANIVANNTDSEISLGVLDSLPGLSPVTAASLLQGGVTAAAVPAGGGALADAAAALDDFRLLGAVDLQINHP